MPNFFNKYPYTDFHELNLDWILETVKQVVADWMQYQLDLNAEWGSVQQDWHDTEEAWISLKNYVENYFANLNVQDEVDNKINAMVADGTMDQLLLPFFTNYETEINNIISSQNGRITVLEQRMDTFSQLTVGSTTGDAELMDGRIGYDGTVYPNIGDAIRGQIGDIITNEPINRQHALIPAINRNLADYYTMRSTSNVVRNNPRTYTIYQGGYMFGVAQMLGVCNKTAHLEFILIAGTSTTLRYRLYGATPGPQTNFTVENLSDGTKRYYADFVATDFDAALPQLEIRLDNRTGTDDVIIKDLVLFVDDTYVGLHPLDTCYVSTTGNDDTGDGSAAYPFATLTKAVSSGFSKVMVKAGVYEQFLNLAYTDIRDITIVCDDIDGKAIFMPLNTLVTDTENSVAGYTKVYSCSYNTAIQSGLNLYQDGIPDADTLISDAERNPYQRGQEYRCYDTKIVATDATVLADALDEIEASTAYKYFFDDDNDLLYFSRPAAVTVSNPIRRAVVGNFIRNADRSFNLRFYGIETKYQAFNVNNSVAFLQDCKCAYAYGTGGFTYNSTLGATFIKCEACGTHFSGGAGDGFSAHSDTTGDPFAKQTTCTMIDCWSHDNRDDGYSDHERSETTIHGGLFEYNAKAGVTPSYGSHCVCFNVLSRRNYSGFIYLGAATAAEGGKYGQLLCYGCVAEDNTDPSSGWGFHVAGNGNKMKLINCKALRNTVGYHSGSDTLSELIDCGAKGNYTPKTFNGSVTINNTTLVT